VSWHGVTASKALGFVERMKQELEELLERNRRANLHYKRRLEEICSEIRKKATQEKGESVTNLSDIIEQFGPISGAGKSRDEGDEPE
jgi:regulator of replication initiation timing